MSRRRDIVIPPSGAVPGQVGKLLTILALNEAGSFTDHKQEPNLTRIIFSSTEETVSCQASDDSVVEKKSPRKCDLVNVGVLVCLMIAYMLCGIAFSIIKPFFPQIANDKGASPLMIGVIISSAPLSTVLMSPVFGYMLLHIKVWCQVLFGLLLVGSSYLSMGFATRSSTTWGFVLACVMLRLLEGVGTAILTTAIFSTFPRLCPKYVGTLMGLFELMFGFGCMMGPTLGGVLYEYGGYELPFLIIGSCILFFTIPSTILLLLIRNLSLVSEKKTLPLRVICSVLTTLPFVLLVAVIATVHSPKGFMSPALPTFLNNEYQQSILQVGILFMIGAMAYLASALPVGPISDKIGHNRLFNVSGLMMVTIGYLMIGIPYYLGSRNMWWIRGSFVMLSSGHAVSVVPIYASLLKIGKRYMRPGDNEAALSTFVSGLIASACSFGIFLGPLVGGVVTTFVPIPTCAIIQSEIVITEALLLLGVTTIERCT